MHTFGEYLQTNRVWTFFLLCCSNVQSAARLLILQDCTGTTQKPDDILWAAERTHDTAKCKLFYSITTNPTRTKVPRARISYML